MIAAVGLAACIPDEASVLPEGPSARAELGDELRCADPMSVGAPLVFDDWTASSGASFEAATPAGMDAGDGYTSADIELLGGFAVADFNGDGHLDLVFTDADAAPRLFFGDGRFGFTEIDAQARGLPTAGRLLIGASAADPDGDGDFDLYLLARGENVFLQNDGSGRFVDRTSQKGLDGGSRRSTTGSWADADGDGDLDLFVANYGTGADGVGGENQAEQDSFLVQEDDGMFHDERDWLYDGALDGFGFIGGWFDADDDGALDLYVINDLAPDEPWYPPNIFIENLGGGGPASFEHAPEAYLDIEMFGMGLAVGDMDNDGDLDVHVSNAGPSFLARNEGGRFTESGLLISGLQEDAGSDISWSTEFFDHDNDGVLELFTAFGHMITKAGRAGPGGTANPVEQPDALWSWDPGAGAYRDIAGAVGLDDPGITRTVVPVDLDRDGFLDVVTMKLHDGPSLHRSRCNDNAWLRIRLEQPDSANRFAVGARVEVWRDGAPWVVRDVTAGSTGAFTSGPPEVHLGLADLETADVVVRWPDGTQTVNPGLPVRREIVLRPP